ncbi:bifunctional tRNA (5-methylaminomethyl-2-thiouridine)(34)-methyltransferase MnmD/FAD-dependent 5-carboxymethylaminomethyl-2-thiouridine(34) oxidoreductase MnmC [Oceanospirillum linum]|uniref:tRNA 5-methylaminomethyl-2-thiouridine biosynthesis bifunctional protein MnmC n=1 Tax=Oceanospirillum linum TaxID=966 RepID=A0A1T1HFA4_OCELI|nr:bifunctional tRNA (5-methylaminomethyl-2-thiouridine)(34)-methyltransferase MnmD/FAD-dependent 5-carboxymethylaminomethyl-2-thiouridine(34) oxidoreductase MnmC [Oceanospirillum linum]OOV88531.1 bifunctional tRNA (5-methylaminomethyl-2-thiouridine)(34)-methyltransferase MnmD/FAD-dependent 5-carboxymethylaminomethyl-2-thiouridine(34) oxidoreductase MnmC [Oceanospirillum linum]SEF59677.1 tRNA 5-methylaminomethyl-2-thiouridine biosynthesis bifunctional protein [Oleiphilus messinensis]SMP06710.1 t
MANNHYQTLNQAKLHWDESQRPISQAFDDVYFSKASGLDETRYVFLQHNGLPERWQKTTFIHRPFVIAETGFGTGLNFLCTWQAFIQHAPEDARLHFVSVEKFPLNINDLEQSLALWPELKPLADQLIAAYPLPIPGFHRRHFDQGRVQLTLIQGDASECFSSLESRVDAWFLDGFAPAKNPDMWTPELFQSIRRLSDKGTTVATFTAAGIVRNGLKAAGFEVKKVKGFGHKRHMVCGELILDAEGQAVQTVNPAPDVVPVEPLPLAKPWMKTPWFKPPCTVNHSNKQHIAIIGAGIAGTTTAQALARHGFNITLIEQHDQAGKEGSGNRQGVLYIKLGTEPSSHSRFYLSGFEFSRHYFNNLQKQLSRTDFKELIWQACGVLQLAYTEKEVKRQKRFIERNNFPDMLLKAVTAEQASELSGTPLQQSGLWFPQAGWARPDIICQQLSQHSNIKRVTGQFVDKLQPADSGWSLLDKDGKTLLKADQVIIACAASTKHFAQTAWLPTKAIRGQTTYLQTTAQTPELKTVVCHEGYIAPALDNTLCLGASFNLKDDEKELRESDQQHNLNLLSEAMPTFAGQLNHSGVDTGTLSGKVGFRCASPDYVPLTGPAPVYKEMLERFALLRHDATKVPDAAPAYYPGLWLNTGHGSRGLASAPLCAEVLAAYIAEQPMPLERELVNALQPSRFIIRGLIRDKL